MERTPLKPELGFHAFRTEYKRCGCLRAQVQDQPSLIGFEVGRQYQSLTVGIDQEMGRQLILDDPVVKGAQEVGTAGNQFFTRGACVARPV